jgi:hypothetical protein
VPKPSVQQVHDVLRRHQGLIVHFSTVPLLDQRYYFPRELHYAIDHPNLEGGLCCSVVKPGDTRNNTFGDVGLIFDLSESESLIAVSRSDGGSRLGPGQVRVFEEQYRNFDIATLEASITTRVGHNEWGVKDFLVRGLFVLSDVVTVCAPQDRLRYVKLAELSELFPGLPVYSFEEKAIVELHPDTKPIRVDHAVIYP